MHKTFTTLEELLAHIKEDKEWTGANAAHHNRYPVRFVLFDNFADFNEFINERPAGIYKHSIDSLLNPDWPDTFLSNTELSKEVRAFVKHIPVNDYVIFPFSEMARFYDNIENTEFDAIVKTVGATQAPEDAQAEHIRIYIPIVGMQGKMNRFMNDNNTFVWEYKSGTEQGTYQLIITNGTTYGVDGLESKYTVVGSLKEWLHLWKQGANVKPTIISSSPNIFKNAHHAQPDNAFTYLECRNAYQFLTSGLGLDFGVTEEPSSEEMPYWEQLASMIDINTFNFEEFVKERLDTFTLNNGVDFIKSWFDCDSDFDRWLLSLYFRRITDKNSYVAKALDACTKLTESELFSNIATLIFDEVNREQYIVERRKAIDLSQKHGVNITDMARHKLKAKLQAIAASPEQGSYYSAVKLLTPLTEEEKQLAIEWVGKGFVKAVEVKDTYPELYHYMQPLGLNDLNGDKQWVSGYIDAYRQSKIADTSLPKVREIIAEKNANPSTFLSWKDEFKTVRTILHNRTDIDVFYWIDGLGIDWIPFIKNIVARYTKEHVYLNEIHVAVSDLPTTTSVNKPKLQSLLPTGVELPKLGNLDTYAHRHHSYPHYIIEEMAIIEKAIVDVLTNYNGKKIAFISDHGLTYLSQYEDGMKLAGVEADHEGRMATVTNGNIGQDNNYIILEDGKTLCSLSHRSLVNKVDKGHGAHGGCTPEEVLVPIIVISSHKNTTNFTASLINNEIDGTKPVAQFKIKGLSSIDNPTLEYNGVTYNLKNVSGDVFDSERLNLVDTATKLTLYINGVKYDTYTIKVSTGASEDTDLFDF
ncbi:MAG: BREX-4 system phosphatase PglZ [Bacteroides sp.]|nr:BREX-4 system phosphatase PglZ [Bacteroides sp.]